MIYLFVSGALGYQQYLGIWKTARQQGRAGDVGALSGEPQS